MVRRLAAGAVVAVAILVGRAEASCTDSQVMIMVPPVVSHPTIPVRWTVGSGCRVIETGLLFGVDPNALNPAGAPVYAARAEYHGSVQAGENGEYWLVAYAVDESGAVAFSARRRVIVGVPPTFPPGPRGSHGPLLTYAGTDADFLQPAGEPHYASLRWVTQTTEGVLGTVGFPPSMLFGSRQVSSTNPNEVRAELAHGLTVGGIAFPIDPQSVDQALAVHDVVFANERFPRPGLYTLLCEIQNFRPGLDTPFPLGCRPLFGDLVLAYHDTVLVSETFTSRARFTYFVPAAPPGKQVDRAIFRVLAHAIGNIETIRVSGETPIALSPFGQCSAASCNLFITWNLTERVRALAAQGGGELPLTIDPIAPYAREGERTGRLAMTVQVNYPWKHLFLGLSMTYKEACPRSLEVTALPEVVRPQVPSTTRLTGPVASLPAEATVLAEVRTCPGGGGTPGAVDVTFKVKPSEIGSAEAGGHAAPHVIPRPEAALGKLEPTTCRITSFDAEGRGSCSVKYTPSEVSGVETVEAEAIGLPDIPKATAKVGVEVPGLTNLADIQTNFFRLTGRTDQHPDNHWGTLHTTESVQLVAFDFFERFGTTLGINDLSLRQGGQFDICGTWNPADRCSRAPNGGHQSHRIGTGVDIDRFAGAVSVPRRYIGERCELRGQGWLVREATIHCEFPQ